MDFKVILLSLPIFALAVSILFATSADSVSSHVMSKARENPAIKFKVIISSIIAPVMILYLNNLLGVVFLTIGGLMLVFQEQLFASHALLRNSTAKVIGYVYLVVGVVWSIRL